jgi:hypothetical protein
VFVALAGAAFGIGGPVGSLTSLGIPLLFEFLSGGASIATRGRLRTVSPFRRANPFEELDLGPEAIRLGG